MMKMHGLLATRAGLALIGVLALLAGCSPVLDAVPEDRLVASGDYRIIEAIDVPPVRGLNGCGAQALAAAIAREDPSVDPVALAEELPWHDVGATPVDLLLTARARGLDARIVSGSWDELAAEVEAGRTVLVMFDAQPEVPTLTGRLPSLPVLHWSMVGGMSTDGERVLLAAERRRHYVVKREEFLRRWEPAANCMIRISAGARG
jgi:hypothetical protein